MAACCVASSRAFVVTALLGTADRDTEGLAEPDGEAGPDRSSTEPVHRIPAAASTARPRRPTKIGFRKSDPSKRAALDRARAFIRNFAVPSRPLRGRTE